MNTIKANVTYSIILQQLLCNISTCIPAVWQGISLQLTEKLSCVLSTQCRAVVAASGAAGHIVKVINILVKCHHIKLWVKLPVNLLECNNIM